MEKISDKLATLIDHEEPDKEVRLNVFAAFDYGKHEDRKWWGEEPDADQ